MTVVKICGITNLADARCAVEAGADMLGFILYPRSPRYIEPQTIITITEEVRATHSNIGLVGVFVNETAQFINDVLLNAALDYAQLSGDEGPDAIMALAGRAYKAIRNGADADRYISSTKAPPALLPDVLLDADHPTLYGGSGIRADASVALTLARQYRILLAGGLKPENVADIIKHVQPWGVDVSSGVESSPGRKDHEKVRAFIQAVKHSALHSV